MDSIDRGRGESTSSNRNADFFRKVGAVLESAVLFVASDAQLIFRVRSSHEVRVTSTECTLMCLPAYTQCTERFCSIKWPKDISLQENWVTFAKFDRFTGRRSVRIEWGLFTLGKS